MIVVSTSSGPNSTPTTTTTQTYFAYDNQKHLSTIKSGNITKTFTYDSNGNLYTISKSDATLPTRTVTEFTYADGKLSQYTIRTYNGANLTSEKPYVYVYDGNKVSEIHFSTGYEKYTYDTNGNISSYLHDEPGLSGGSYFYSYDDKKSMFTNSLFKYPTVGDVFGFIDGYLYHILFPFNQNNTSVVYPDSLHQTVQASYKYNYDDDGYPTSAVLTPSPLSGGATNKYTFEYSTLQ